MIIKIFLPSWSCCRRPASIFPRHIPQTWDQCSQLSLHNPFTVRTRPLSPVTDSRLLQWGAGRLVYSLPLLPLPLLLRVRLCCSPAPLTRLQSLRGAEELLDKLPAMDGDNRIKPVWLGEIFSKVSLNSSNREEGTRERGSRVWKVCPEPKRDRRERRANLLHWYSPAASLHVDPPLACVSPWYATRLLITCHIIMSPTVSHELMALFHSFSYHVL